MAKTEPVVKPGTTQSVQKQEQKPFLNPGKMYFGGGGLSQPISGNTWLMAELLFDVIQNENSPYAA